MCVRRDVRGRWETAPRKHKVNQQGQIWSSQGSELVTRTPSYYDSIPDAQKKAKVPAGKVTTSLASGEVPTDTELAPLSPQHAQTAGGGPAVDAGQWPQSHTAGGLTLLREPRQPHPLNVRLPWSL